MAATPQHASCTLSLSLTCQTGMDDETQREKRTEQAACISWFCCLHTAHPGPSAAPREEAGGASLEPALGRSRPKLGKQAGDDTGNGQHRAVRHHVDACTVCGMYDHSNCT